MSAVLALTLFHVLVSLVAVVAGIGLVLAFLSNRRAPRWTMWFFVSMGATLVTSFLFPFKGMTPAIAIGILCVVIFVPTWYARYRTPLTGFWRPVYVIGTMLLVFFNCLVLIVQSFQKIGPLHALAPLGNELPIVICQGVLLVVAVAAGVLSILRFKPRPAGVRLVA